MGKLCDKAWLAERIGELSMKKVKTEVLKTAPIENVTVSKIFVDGVHTQYEIVPNEGFKLHDARLDTEAMDEETLEPIGEMIPGFKRKGVTVRCDYDFKKNSNEFYAVKEYQ